MANVLMISSWVAHGHVGLSAAALAAQQLGHSVTQIPMIILSNHPGWSHVAGMPVPVDRVMSMLKALAENGFLRELDGILVGYMPSVAHVEAVAEWLDTLPDHEARIVVDPILGDTPGGLYVAEDVASAVRDSLCPMADILTPNGFEASWLTELTVTDGATAAEAASVLKANRVLVTSVPEGDTIGVHLFEPNGIESWQVPQKTGVPHGVGDVLAGLLASGALVGQALGHLSALIDASLEAPHLRIAEAAQDWVSATSVPGRIWVED